MEKIKVRRQLKKHIYVHNNLSNAAHHFKKSIDDRIANNELKGIAFEILAELVFLAFTVEARINFLGSKLVTDWDEGERFWKKVKRVLKHLRLQVDFDLRPYSTIQKLKILRDSIAHGKPVHLELDEDAVIDADQGYESVYLRAEWESYCNEVFAKEAYEDMDKIWKELLSASKLSLFDTLSSEEGTVIFIERLTDQDA